MIGIGDHGADKKSKLICKCDCGSIREVDAYSIKHGFTKSCGGCKTIESEGEHRRCIMKNGASFIFDSQDEEIVKLHSWSIARGRVRTTVDGKTVYFHQFVLKPPDGAEVDHVNGNKLDNRRCNLRVATHSQNNQNKRLRRDNTTGYKGVCFDKRAGKYIAYINANGARTYLGYFDDSLLAAMAYDRAAIRLHGEYAKTNFGTGGIYEEVLELETA